MSWFALVVAAIASLLLGVQVWARVKARRMRGTPVPNLDGLPGRALLSGKPAIFYFHSPGCRACRAMTPMVRELAGERDDVFAINAAENGSIAVAFGVMATPTTVRTASGFVTDFLLGPLTRNALLQLLQREESTS